MTYCRCYQICSADEHMATFIEIPYLNSYFRSFWKKYIVCDICGLKSPSFETTYALYTCITPTKYREAI